MEIIGLDLHKRESQRSSKADDGTITDRRIVTSRERFTAVLGGRPVASTRVPRLQHREQLPRAPIVVVDPKLAAERRHLVRDLVRTVMRRATAVRHAAPPLRCLAE